MPDDLDLLRRLGRELSEPDEENIARARELLERRISGASAETAAARASGRRPRWALAVAAVVALLVGSGLGFGLASFLTPSGSARSNVVGFGFIPARGWNVVQTGTLGPSGVAHAIAANIPLGIASDAKDVPPAALRRLPPNGIVIAARFQPRGDEVRDEGFPLRTLPLSVADAVPFEPPAALSRTRVAALRLRAGSGGYNVDARVYFGGPPGPATLNAVDVQLERLVVAQSGITLNVVPRVFSSTSDRMNIFGSVESGRGGEKVTIQFRACGIQPVEFRDTFETTTRAGGGFSFASLAPFSLGVSGVFRALAGDAVSPLVPVQQRASVYLRAPRGGRFEAAVWGVVSFWRRHVVLQRFDRSRGTWIAIRRLLLTKQVGGGVVAPPNRVAGVGAETEPFRPKVPRGTRIRVVFPLSQARPCYIAGVSDIRQT